jgi:predicted DNA-binding transcriptional regulator YafY
MYWARHLVKVFKAVDLLSRPGGATVDDLASHLEVSKRTAYRVISTLEEMHFPLAEEPSSYHGKKRYVFEESYRKKLPNLSVPVLQLTLPEVMALSLLRGGAGLFKGTEIEKSVASAFEKLGAFAPEELAKRLDRLRILVAASGRFTKDYRDKDAVIESLTEAMLRQRTCLVEYHSFGDDRVKRFRIDPLRFFERDGGLYVFVKATTFGTILVLAVERIRKLKVTDEAFKAPKDFDPEALLESAFNLTLDDPITVRVRFSADQARYVKERRWAAKQRIADQKDGSVILTLETSGRWDVKRWLLGFGTDAELLEPADLRREIAADLRKLAKAYAAKQASAAAPRSTSATGTSPHPRGRRPAAPPRASAAGS